MSIVTIILKELKIYLSDKKALAIMILMPIILTTILSFSLKGSFMAGGGEFKIDIAIVKKYDGEEEKERAKDIIAGMMSQSDLESNNLDMDQMEDINLDKIFFKEFLGMEEIKKIIHYTILSEKEAIKQLEEEKISSIIILPEGFVYDNYINMLTTYRNKVEIQIINHPEKSYSGQIIEAITNGFIEVLDTMIINKIVFFDTLAEKGLLTIEAFKKTADIIEELVNNKSDIEIAYTEREANKSISSFAYYSVAMMTMFIFFSAGFGGTRLLEEIRNGTYQRLTVNGVTKRNIIISNYFSIFLITFIQMLIMIVFSSLLLKVDWGNMIYVSIITLCTAFAIGGLGTLIAVITMISGNPNVAKVSEMVLAQTMALLGGSFIPLEVMPEFMGTVSNFTINGLAIKAYIKVMQGNIFSDLYENIIPIMIFGLVFIIISIGILKKKEGELYA